MHVMQVIGLCIDQKLLDDNLVQPALVRAKQKETELQQAAARALDSLRQHEQHSSRHSSRKREAHAPADKPAKIHRITIGSSGGAEGMQTFAAELTDEYGSSANR